jgi:hypothetical protein
MGRFKCAKYNTMANTFFKNFYIYINKKGNIHKKFLCTPFGSSTFCPNLENKPFVDHIDGNRSNNKASNLRWVTREENMANPNTTRNRKVLQKCLTTGQILNRFSSMEQAAKHVGAYRAGISCGCRSKSKVYRGYVWEHDNDS